MTARRACTATVTSSRIKAPRSFTVLVCQYVDVAIATDRTLATYGACHIAIAGGCVETASITLFIGRRIDISIATRGGLAANAKAVHIGQVGIAIWRISCARIALLPGYRIGNPIATNEASEMTIGGTDIVGSSVEIAVIACLCGLSFLVDNPISTRLVRVAIGATAVTIEDVAVVADFAALDNTVTAADVYAYRLIGSADLPRLAM